MTAVSEEIRLQGIPISGGIAIGTIHVVHHDDDWVVPEYEIEHIEEEIDRYRQALQKSREELLELQQFFEGEGAAIIGAQIQMLEDPLLTIELESRITLSKKNGESVFKGFMAEYMSFFSEEERLLDVKDIAARVLKHLYPHGTHPSIGGQGIVCSYELVPSYTAEASVQAFVTEIGGSTSHTALIAKAKAIPYVSNVRMDLIREQSGSVVIVDGNYGSVIVNPSPATIKMYQRKQQGQSVRFEPIHEEEGEVRTLDGTLVEVQANVENLADLELLKRAKIRKIGLVRSEFLCMRKELDLLSENEQYQIYKKLVQLAGEMEITFRLFDIGSDKKLLSVKGHEPNPALGERSIRFLLKHRKLFTTQIRAILRASQLGNVHLMLPLVTDIHELIEAKQVIYEEYKNLGMTGKLSIGCMVEVPAFVILCDEFAEECDFLSIGTNDLTQYTLAVDRSNPRTNDLYGEAHPSILWMIAHVVKVGDAKGVPVSICGELASNPRYTQTLLELGVRSLSCAPRYTSAIKKAIRQIDLSK
ncbi:MAG: phosphoenolpyruvate--protein phosphotransferase [Chlamydiae bacterium]|nr:phosphoenolpyruvate--protein phosphotransferase [Chlamydiota bacterium]